MLGDDILYVQKWPWSGVEDWWNYANRPEPHPREAAALNRVIKVPRIRCCPAVPVAGRQATIKVNDSSWNGVYTLGTTAGGPSSPRLSTGRGDSSMTLNLPPRGRSSLLAVTWPMRFPGA